MVVRTEKRCACGLPSSVPHTTASRENHTKGPVSQLHSHVTSQVDYNHSPRGWRPRQQWLDFIVVAVHSLRRVVVPMHPRARRLADGLMHVPPSPRRCDDDQKDDQHTFESALLGFCWLLMARARKPRANITCRRHSDTRFRPLLSLEAKPRRWSPHTSHKRREQKSTEQNRTEQNRTEQHGCARVRRCTTQREPRTTTSLPLGGLMVPWPHR